MAADVDLEVMSASTRRLDGYPTFAEFIAKDKDAAIYRRFENLSARNLLYLQSELHDLERQLEELDRKDAQDIGDANAQKAARLWTHYANDTNEQAIARRKLQRIIKKKIKEYRMYRWKGQAYLLLTVKGQMKPWSSKARCYPSTHPRHGP